MAKQNKRKQATTKSSIAETKMLIVLLCVVMLGAGFYFGYKNFSDKAKELEVKNEGLLEELVPMREMAAAVPEYEEATAENLNEIEEITKLYGPGYTPKSLLVKYDEMERNCDMVVSSISFGTSELLYSDPNVETEAGEGIYAYRAPISIAATTDYAGISKFADYINQYTDRTTFDNVTLAAADGGTFAISATINEYAVIGEDGKIYIDPTYTNTDLGVDNLFGNLNLNVDEE